MVGNRPRFGAYELELRLSIGVMCETFVARTQDGQRVALKRLLPSAEESPEAVAMFHEEMKLAELVSHPCLTQFVDAGYVERRPYLVSRFVSGVSVRQLFQTAQTSDHLIPIEAIAALGVEAGRALDYLHNFADPTGKALDIVHRDVSPKNILVGRSGNVHLADLGIARFSGRDVHTAAGMLKGTASYMSPEQVRGEPLDATSDLFSLATVLFELWSSERLFHEGSLIETYDRVERAELPRHVPRQRTKNGPLETSLRHALAQRPTDRPASVHSFVTSLLPLLGNRPANTVLKQTLDVLWPSGVPEPMGEDLGRYRAGLSSAEERGEDTTDQSERSDITRWATSPPAPNSVSED